MALMYQIIYVVPLIFAGAVLAGDVSIGPFTRVGEYDHIIGGEDADQNEFPWQVELMYKGRFLCGGSILSDTVILTAAHCNVGGSARHYSIRAGEYDRFSNDGTEQIVSARRWIKNNQQRYDSRLIRNDIALIMLRSPLNFTASVQPLTLSDAAFDDYAETSTRCFSTGYGLTGQGPNVHPDIVQELNTSVLTHAQCLSELSSYGVQSYLYDTNVCAMREDAGVCFGDSGGPIGCYDDDDNFRQIGVTSWIPTSNCGNGPSVYTRVSQYLSWIDSKL